MVDPTRWERIWRLYERLVDCPLDKRSRFFDNAGAEDRELRGEVEELLSGSLPPTGFLERAGLDEPPVDSLVGSTVGPYRIVAEVGRGGMGVVYDAEQQQPVRRRVALKLLGSGFHSAELRTRFESEQQALAAMAHPGIAKVFDVGATSDGRPYFAMEYVEGKTLTTHCDDERLTLRERLELFLLVCSAVQHAHQKGIVHRDLKPANIVVTTETAPGGERVRPIVIDFGVAKLLDRKLDETTGQTKLGTLLGTPEYMSPEQWEMAGDVDTRTDVYALGVVLFELLTGGLPVDLRGRSFGEAWRLRREQEPVRPSVSLAGLSPELLQQRAALRRCAPAAFRKALSGDLDWIVMKAIANERDRRYASASELAADVERHLNDQPVEVGPPGRIYRMRKFVSRHRVAVAAAAAVVVALVAGLVGTLWMARAAIEAREEARREAAAALAASGFLEDMFAAADPGDQRATFGVDTRVGDVLERAARRLDGEFADQPRVEARLRRSLARTYSSLGDAQASLPLVRRSLELHVTHLGKDHPTTLDTRLQYGVALWQARWPDGFAEALEVLEAVHDDATRELGPAHSVTRAALTQILQLLRWSGRHREARQLARAKLALAEDELGGKIPPDAVPLDFYARLARLGLEAPAERLELLARVVERKRSALGDRHPATVEARRYVATRQSLAGDARMAVEAWPDLLVESQRLHGEDSSEAIQDHWTYGRALVRLDDPGEAETVLRRALALAAGRFGEGSTMHRETARRLGEALVAADRLDEAEALFRAALEACLPSDSDAPFLRLNLGKVYTALGDYPLAERHLLVAFESWRDEPIAHPPGWVNRGSQALAELYESWGKPEVAARYRTASD